MLVYFQHCRTQCIKALLTEKEHIQSTATVSLPPHLVSISRNLAGQEKDIAVGFQSTDVAEVWFHTMEAPSLVQS